jgi:hypothetical protein
MMIMMKRMKNGAGRREWSIFFIFFLLKKNFPLEKISWKTPPRAHTSPLYWTTGSTNFKIFFTVLCSHTILIVYEYSGMSLCAQFLVFLVYRSTDGRTDGQTINRCWAPQPPVGWG